MKRKEIQVADIQENMADLIGKRWMLISAGNNDKFNTMTASWGFMGYYANKYCAVIFIRPERYTYQFIEHSDTLTLSFLGEEYRSALSILGTKSGRECDKIAMSGLTPQFTADRNPTFAEADLVLECRKIYASMLDADSFTDRSIVEKWYGGQHGELHKMYMVQITKVWSKE